MCRMAPVEGELPERSLPTSFGRITLMNTYGEMFRTAGSSIWSQAEFFLKKQQKTNKDGQAMA